VLPRIVGLAVIGVAFTACGGSSGANNSSPGPPQRPPSLVGDVGHDDGFSISLTDPNGRRIRNLAAGTYSLAIKDESSLHNFHLTGAGVDKTTSIGDKGTVTFSVTFTPGTYTFVCDPHSSQMHGKFTVT
jgi:Copper binding proteins, plastocyanin/azurin family